MAIHRKALKRENDPALARGNDWQGASFEEIARRQGVRPIERVEDLVGGWPPEEIDDGFEEVVVRWRQADLAAWNERPRISGMGIEKSHR